MPNPENLRPKPWPKGVSGNPAGRPPRKRIEEMIQDFLYEVARSKDGQERQRLEVLLARLFSDGAQGNVRSTETLLAYGFGKPVNKNEHSGPDGGPIESKAEHALAGITIEELRNLAKLGS
jgi:hypothetical protein